MTPQLVRKGIRVENTPPSKTRLFAEAPATMPEVTKTDLKRNSEFRLIGKAVPRRDIPEKVDGSARYAIDVQLPGMVYASTVHSPVQLARPIRWNGDAIQAMKGVIDVVPLEHGVAVVAETFEQVLAARKALEVVWAEGARAQGCDSEDALMSTYETIAGDESAVSNTVGEKGDVDTAFANAVKVFRASFRSDYGYPRTDGTAERGGPVQRGR